jgi:hypothetical protein
MKRKDRFITKDNFFYALVIVATLALTRLAFLVELVEQTSVFTSHAAEAQQASVDEVRWKESAIYVARAGEWK